MSKETAEKIRIIQTEITLLTRLLYRYSHSKTKTLTQTSDFDTFTTIDSIKAFARVSSHRKTDVGALLPLPNESKLVLDFIKLRLSLDSSFGT